MAKTPTYEQVKLSTKLQRTIPRGHRTSQEGMLDAKIRSPIKKPHTTEYITAYRREQLNWK